MGPLSAVPMRCGRGGIFFSRFPGDFTATRSFVLDIFFFSTFNRPSGERRPRIIWIRKIRRGENSPEAAIKIRMRDSRTIQRSGRSLIFRTCSYRLALVTLVRAPYASIGTAGWSLRAFRLIEIHARPDIADRPAARRRAVMRALDRERRFEFLLRAERSRARAGLARALIKNGGINSGRADRTRLPPRPTANPKMLLYVGHGATAPRERGVVSNFCAVRLARAGTCSNYQCKNKMPFSCHSRPAQGPSTITLAERFDFLSACHSDVKFYESDAPSPHSSHYTRAKNTIVYFASHARPILDERFAFRKSSWAPTIDPPSRDCNCRTRRGFNAFHRDFNARHSRVGVAAQTRTLLYII